MVVRTPWAAPGGGAAQFSSLLVPTLVFAEPSVAARDPSSEGARSLSAAMQRAVLVEARPSGRGGAVYSEQLAEQMLKLFAAHGHLGHLPDLGHNPKAALLTKLAGGLRSWEEGR